MVGSGPNNGYSGDYSGYTIFTRTNAGTAEVKGWEIDYRQQFPFLPGALKGLELAANYTVLKTQGNFGGTTVTRDTEVAGFVPKTGNVSLSYTYDRFGTRITYNYASDYLSSFNTTRALRLYTTNLKTVIWSFSYRYRPDVNFSLDFSNAFGATRQQHQYMPGRTSQIYVPNKMISFGVSGHF